MSGASGGSAPARDSDAERAGSALPTIVLVGDQESVHIERWREGLRELGHHVVPVHLSGRGRSRLDRLRQLLAVRRQLGRVSGRPNTVIAVHYVRGGVVATALRGLHPIVLSVWGRDVTSERRSAWGRLYGWQQRGLVQRAEAVTATSAFLAGVVRRRFHVEAEVVPFGVDLERFRPDREQPGAPVEADDMADSAAPRRSGALRIGFVKWLEPKYGADVLVEALGLLRDELPFDATLVGDGELEPRLAARVLELDIADRVTFLGRRPHAEIPGLLRGFDVFAMPSREEEWGVAAAEASASGLPVVATRVGGIPEIVVDGETGLLVPPEDPAALAAAIGRLAADPHLRRSMGRAGRERVAALYPWQRCTRQMSGVFLRVATPAAQRVDS